MVSVSVLRNYAKVCLATKQEMKHKQMNPLARVRHVGSRLVSNTHLKNIYLGRSQRYKGTVNHNRAQCTVLLLKHCSHYRTDVIDDNPEALLTLLIMTHSSPLPWGCPFWLTQLKANIQVSLATRQIIMSANNMSSLTAACSRLRPDKPPCIPRKLKTLSRPVRQIAAG